MLQDDVCSQPKCFKMMKDVDNEVGRMQKLC